MTQTMSRPFRVFTVRPMNLRGPRHRSFPKRRRGPHLAAAEQHDVLHHDQLCNDLLADSSAAGATVMASRARGAIYSCDAGDALEIDSM